MATQTVIDKGVWIDRGGNADTHGGLVSGTGDG